MGLEESRRQLALTATAVPMAQAELERIVGAPITVEVVWDSFERADQMDMLGQYSFSNLVEGIRAVCADDLGKQAVRSAVQTIRLLHRPTADSVSMLSLANGVLEVAWDYSSGTYFTSAALQERLTGLL